MQGLERPEGKIAESRNDFKGNLMDVSLKPKRRIAARLTSLDREAYDLIARNDGWVRYSSTGGPALESNTQIGPGRLRRLEALGYLAPNNDRLFEDGPAQTYSIISALPMENET